MKRHQRIGAGGQASLFQQISSCSSTKKPSIGTVKNQLEKSILGNENARTEMLNRNKQKNPLQSSHGSIFCLLFRKIFFLFFLLLFQNQRKVRIISDGEKIKRIGNKSTPNGTNEFSSKKKLIYFFLFKFRSEEEIQMDAHLESILACECTMIVLDTIETIIQVVQTTDCHQILLPGLLKILLHAFALNQSTWTLQNLFSHQRAIVYKVKSQKKIRRFCNWILVSWIIIRRRYRTLCWSMSSFAKTLFVLFEYNSFACVGITLFTYETKFWNWKCKRKRILFRIFDRRKSLF